MAAFENIEELKTTLADCIDENERLCKMQYNPCDKDQIRYRYYFYCDYIKELEDVAGDLIEFCKDFVEENIHLGCEEYLNNTDKTMNEISAGKDRRTLWHNCFALFPLCAKDVKKYESDRRLDKYTSELKYCEVWLTSKESNKCYQIPNPYGKHDALYAYCKLRKHFEYKVLSRLYDYLNNKLGNSFVVDKEQLIILTRALFLYIAMRNERKQVLKDAKYARLNLEELQGTTLAPQGKAKKKTKQPREVFTERAKKYFEKAEEAGYLKKVGNKYEWLYRGGVVALVYFFIRIYEPKSPPFKQLQPLFGVEGLTSSRRNLEQTDWYKDEMKREAMTPEELARERRERKLKEPKEWFPELKSFFED